MILLALLATVIYHAIFQVSAAPVGDSDVHVTLKRIDEVAERNHVWAVHQRRRAEERRQISLLQLSHRAQTRFAGIRLHDQIGRPATYFAEIGVGNNPTLTFRVLFDTGSCEFWIPDESCLSKQCRGHRKYKKSSTFETQFNTDGSASLLNIQYLSGSLHGYGGYDTVHLGRDIAVPRTSIGFATRLDIPLLQELEWDGIVGLGFKNHEISERGVLPFIDHVVSSGVLKRKNLANQFAYYLSVEGGAMTFGGADLSKKENPAEEFSWVSVDPSNSYWTVKVLSVKKSGRIGSYATKIANFANKLRDEYDTGGASIIDTGTYLIYAPTRVMENYLSDLHISTCEDKSTLPDLVFQFEGVHNREGPTLVELQLNPDDYVLEFVNDNGLHECMLGIAADDSEEEDGLRGWTFGQVFLRGYYAVFDRDNLAIGLVRAKH